MTANSIADILEQFLRLQYGVDDQDRHFARNTDLMAAGYVDSIAVVELLAFIDQEFRVEIPEADLLSAEFTTINGMACVIERLTASAA
jgi:acyl carrier protein